MPEEFVQSMEAELMTDSAFRQKLLKLIEQSEAASPEQVSEEGPPNVEDVPILPDEELLERSNRRGPQEHLMGHVPIENPLEKKILSGFRLPEDDNDPYFSGMRPHEISNMRHVQAQVLGEKPINETGENIARAGGAGLLKTIDSLTTFPERMADMASGEMEAQGDNYEPDWSFSKQFNIEPLIYTSEWAPYLENIAHFTSLGVGIMGAIAASPYSLPTFGGPVVSRFLQGAMIGATQDALSIESHEKTASSWLVDKWPATERLVGALAVDDSDSPLAIYLKNIIEGMGFEALLGGTWELLGQGLSAAKRSRLKGKVKSSALTKLEDRFNQAKTKGQAEFDEQNEFLQTISELERRQTTGQEINIKAEDVPPSPYMGARGHKNKPVVDPWQGSPISRSTPYDNFNNLNKIDKEDSVGSVDAIFTALEAEDMATNGINKNILNRIKNNLINDQRFKDIASKAKDKGLSTYSTFKRSFDRYAEIAGLNFNNPKADWDAFLKRTGMSIEDIISHETIINSVTKVSRDLATAAKQIKAMGGDIFSVDGPMKSIADRLVTGFDLINYNRVAAKTNVKNATKISPDIHKENLEGVDLLMNFLNREAPEELIDEVLTFLSTSHRSGKLSDFNNWMRQKMTGGDMLPGANKQGALLDELNQIHINSFFGPKTAQRALWGTGFNSYLNQFNDTLGAALRYPITRDTKQFKAQFASLMSMIDFIPDAFKIFKGNLSEAFRKGADIDTRFTEYGRRHNIDRSYEQWLELEGTEADRIVWNMWQVAHNLNGETNLGRAASGVSRVMDAADKTFNQLVRHKRVKEVAMRDALLSQEKGDISEITPAVLDAAGKLYEQKFYNEFGDLDLKRDAFTNSEFLEVTYRTELEGAAKAFSEMIEQMPYIKSYFRFIRSGINGLKVKTQNMPLLAGMLKKERDIFFAKPGQLDNVRKYGIESDWDLERMKGRQLSRQAVGMGLTYVAVQKFLGGGLWGNGPNVQGLRNVFRDTGGEPNTIEIGGKRVSLDLFEPFDLLFKGVADVGANMHIMGEEWAEEKLQAFAIVTAFSEAATDESFLSAVGDLVDIVRGKPGSVSRLTSNIAHFVPFGGWRRFAGQALTDSYREINSSIWNDKGLLESGPIQAIRKDNLLTEFLAPLSGTDRLPLKYNMLNGKPFKKPDGSWNILGGVFRAGSMVAIEPGASPGQKLLWRSNYDLRTSTWYSPGPNSISLKDHANIRSEFSEEIGLTKINGMNPEEWLNDLAKNPRIIASINEMIQDKRNGNYDLNPMKAYYHNKVIRSGFERRRKLAWSKVRQLPEVKELIRKQIDKKIETNSKLYKTTHQELLLPTR